MMNRLKKFENYFTSKKFLEFKLGEKEK